MSRIVATSKRSGYIALAIALVIQTGLISIQATHRIDTSLVRAWILDSLAPMEKLVDRSLHGVASVWDNYFFLIGLHQVHEGLRVEVSDLRIKLDRQEQDVPEGQRFPALLALVD